jgi:hypothetical protein
MDDVLARATAVVAARRLETPEGPMPPSAVPAGDLPPRLARYVLEDPDPDLTMLARLVAMREARADTTDVALAIFNNSAPESLRMTREQMVRRAAETLRSERA